MISTPSLSAWVTVGRLVGDHLWQSTLFAAVVGSLTLAFRNNRAEVRNRLWLAASVKFLIPFAALVAIGSHLSWRQAAPLAQNPAPFVIDMDTMSQPFSRLAAGTPPVVVSRGMALVVPILLFAIWLCGCAAILLTWWTRWRLVAVAVREASPVKQGPELDALRRLEVIVGITKPVALVSSSASLEPGVFGIARPVLLWPRSLAERLTNTDAEMILVHELSHVRRRDNLAAAVHMVVEAIFWFHPLVWWLGTRMVDERERACDEDVLRIGKEAQVYAQSILSVCQFYVESPLNCVSGVTGSDLKKRIERIMKEHFGEALSSWKKLLLATAGIAALTLPIVAGVLISPGHALNQIFGAKAEKMLFEVASVKLSKAPGRGTSNLSLDVDDTFAPTGGLFSVTNTPLWVYLRFAYKSTLSTPGLPAWGRSDRFDIEARAKGNPTKDQFRLMMQSLLADRFKLVMHTETRQSPIYALVMAKPGKNGPQLQPDNGPCVTTADDLKAGGAASELPAAAPSASAALQIPGIPCGVLIPVPPSAPGRIRIAGRKVTLALLAMMAASPVSGVDRPVFDSTGLTGTFDMSFEFTPRPNSVSGPPPPGFTPDDAGPTFFEAVQDELGLKLESQTGPVDVLIIDHVEEPSPN